MRKAVYAATIALMVIASSASAEMTLRKDVDPFEGTVTFTIGVEAERKSTILVVSCEADKEAETRLGLMNTYFFVNDPYLSDDDVLTFEITADGGSVTALDFVVIRGGQSVVPVDMDMFTEVVFNADLLSIRRGEWYDTFDLTAKPSEFEDAKETCLGQR